MDFNVNGITIEEVVKDDNSMKKRVEKYVASLLAKKKNEDAEGDTKDV